MAASTTPVDGQFWRSTLILRLQNRNKSESYAFKDLIAFHNRLFESSNALRAENLQLSVQNEKLRLEHSASTDKASSDNSGNGSSKSPNRNEKVQVLEQKLLSLQEELTEMHRRKGENAQQLVDLNLKLQEKERQLQSKEASFSECQAENSSLKRDIQDYQTNIKKLENLNQIIRDEYQANQLAFAALEEKLRKTQDENRLLVERLVRYKSKDADKMNEDNENFLSGGSHNTTSSLLHTIDGLFSRKKQAKVQKELEDAAKESRAVSPESTFGDRGDLGANPFFASNVPSKAISKFEAHDQEINAVKWSSLERLVATGGADRKVKLWDISKGGQHESKGVLVGSNAAVMSIDFDSTGSLILGASNDFATRVWTVSDHRLRVRVLQSAGVWPSECTHSNCYANTILSPHTLLRG
ncbi:autophagy-related protein 16-1 isoform X2 [Frankliniella occidentalis]|uniref:Autophagy-related protein 16-1 isoform X2 n=1 Tax=Frankliniella occidentalis TaxID=133901 RepID=A0A9C6UAJ0_FRAOC|nr:autophagy-related protein 16-1 isoform X2 [Frankliniella occidentalis]